LADAMNAVLEAQVCMISVIPIGLPGGWPRDVLDPRMKR